MSRQNDRTDIVIVGGGAAGLAAAVVAGETLRKSGMGRVVLCEASDRVGRSILATGNGRCNFSNAQLADEVLRDAAALEPFYRNASFVSEVFAALEELPLLKKDIPERASFLNEAPNAVLRFFADHGLVWREEGEGRLYPLANKASSVLDVLRAAVEAAHVEVRTEYAVEDVRRQSDGDFLLKAEDGRELRAQRVILAVGGAVNERLADSLGLPFVSQRPVLGPLAVDAKDRRITKRLDNIRVKVRATLLRAHGRSSSVVRCEEGEVLFRTYGLSGIAVFDLSREARPGDEISLALLPSAVTVDIPGFLADRAERLLRESGKVATYGAVLRGLVLPQVADALCAEARVKADDVCNPSDIDHVANMLFDWRFTVEGIGDERQCQVKRGGVSVDPLDAATLEALAPRGLYVAGEAVDVDAACGGFNLHWAWASGMLAGYAAARAMEEGR